MTCLLRSWLTQTPARTCQLCIDPVTYAYGVSLLRVAEVCQRLYRITPTAGNLALAADVTVAKGLVAQGGSRLEGPLSTGWYRQRETNDWRWRE